MKRLFTLLILIFSFKSYSQQLGYRNGLIVTQATDTIICLVPTASSFGDKVIIQRSSESDEEKIPLSNIKYLITQTNLYENVAFKKKEKEVHKLMWLEVEGKLNLYLELIVNAGATTHQLGGTVTSYNAPTKTYVIKKADTTYLIEEKHFIETIKLLISDNTDLVHKVDTKVFKYDDIEAVVKEYNETKID